LADELRRVGIGQHVAHAATRPEGDRVEAARFGVNAALALTVTFGKDELRVECEEVVGFGPQLAPDPGKLIGDVHVGPLHETFEDRAARGVRDIQRDATLVPVGELEQIVDAVRGRRQPVADD